MQNGNCSQLAFVKVIHPKQAKEEITTDNVQQTTEIKVSVLTSINNKLDLLVKLELSNNSLQATVKYPGQPPLLKIPSSMSLSTEITLLDKQQTPQNTTAHHCQTLTFQSQGPD